MEKAGAPGKLGRYDSKERTTCVMWDSSADYFKGGIDIVHFDIFLDDQTECLVATAEVLVALT